MAGSVKALLVLGRQGAGKGVQCARLAEQFGYRQLSTGALLRDAIADGASLGDLAAPFVSAGELVPDDLLVPLIAEELDRAGTRSETVLLDGFPRTLDQLDLLDDLLDGGSSLLALHLTVPRHVALDRLAGRGRDDDTLPAIERRLDLYDDETRPLLHQLSMQGRLVSVDGTGAPDEVAARLTDIVAPAMPATPRSGLTALLRASAASQGQPAHEERVRAWR